ncbi:MAG: FHA domain-containing protein [Myxococcota bacterium]
MTQPIPLTRLHALARRNSAADQEVLRELGEWLLVGRIPPEEDGQWSFRTEFRSNPFPPAPDGSGLTADVSCWPLRKRDPRAFQNVILVGRAGSNDAVVLHSQVSKLHARIKVAPEGFLLEDAGSSNGTFLNGSRLKSGSPAPLVHGATVGLGAVLLTVFQREQLVKWLAARPSLAPA